MTSGTTGRPIKILDTPEDWSRFCHIYGRNLYAYGIRKTDMAMPAFSFGPWIGFWAGFYACQEIGCLLFASGGMKTEQRIDALVTYPITVIGCTPSYAIHMADVAAKKTESILPGKPTYASPGIPERPGPSSPACGRRSRRHTGVNALIFSVRRRSAPGDLTANFSPDLPT